MPIFQFLEGFSNSSMPSRELVLLGIRHVLMHKKKYRQVLSMSTQNCLYHTYTQSELTCSGLQP